MILAMFDRLGVTQAEGFDHIHGLIEATKQAFIVRDEHVGDPDHMTVNPASFLDDAKLDELARHIDRKIALPWPHVRKPGDTIWLGVIDGHGRSASFIQSVYFEFGSGVVLPETGDLLAESRRLVPACREWLECAEAGPQAVPHAQSRDGDLR